MAIGICYMNSVCCQIKRAANIQALRQAWEGGQNSKDFHRISTVTIRQKDFVISTAICICHTNSVYHLHVMFVAQR